MLNISILTTVCNALHVLVGFRQLSLCSFAKTSGKTKPSHNCSVNPSHNCPVSIFHYCIKDSLRIICLNSWHYGKKEYIQCPKKNIFFITESPAFLSRRTSSVNNGIS